MFNSASYWTRYKLFHPKKAKAIESLGVFPGFMPDDEAKMFVQSIERLSYRFECPIERLREAYFSSIGSIASWNPVLLKAMEQTKLNVEAPREAKEFNIKEKCTGAYLLSVWLFNRVCEIERNKMIEEHLEKLTGKTGEQLMDEMNEKLEHPLAPDLKRGANLENKIIKIAHELVNYLEYYYQPMSNRGRRDALVYCCILLVKFRPDHGNTIFLSNLCDRVFLILVDEITTGFPLEYDDFYKLFNQRTIRWSDPNYPAASLYKCFYLYPLEDVAEYDDVSDVKEKYVNPFAAVLDAMKLQIVSKHGDLRTEPDVKLLEKPEYLKQFGLTSFAINNLIGVQEPEPKPLIIGKDYSIAVNYDGFKCRVKLSPIEKAIYMLFLNHPEGINFKDLSNHRKELAELYKKISRRNSEEEIDKTISRLIDPFNNSINEKCARIKRAFEDSVPKELVHWYVISGEKGGKKEIKIPIVFRKMIRDNEYF